MKLKLSYLLAAAAISTAIGAHAQDNKPERPSREEVREKFKTMTPEEREKQIKEWREKQGTGGPQSDQRRPDMETAMKQLGLKPEEMRNLSPEERRTKTNEAVDKKLAELNKKKAAKTITEEESKFLERLEARKKFGQDREGAPGKEGAPGQALKEGRPGRDAKPSKDGTPAKPGPEQRRSGEKGSDKPSKK
ncbi:MAG: hypothetical protein H0X66_05850 [Verrucomicrobia bacterium]|nr:hypothetical protein [Verrucomicrobiota bacterium]